MSAGNQPSLGPLLEQQLLLTAEASPQPFVLFLLVREDGPRFSRSEARWVSPPAKPTPRVLSHSFFLRYLFKLFSLTPLPSEFSWRHICSQMTVHQVRDPVLTFWENFVFFLQIKFLHSKEVPYPCVPFHTSASIVIAVLEYSSVFLILLGCLKFSIKIIYLLFPAKVILLSAGLMYLTLTNLHKYCISV